ncbi:MAG: TlpA disulfide reductase family protein [Rikenellaceae bacterium]
MKKSNSKLLLLIALVVIIGVVVLILPNGEINTPTQIEEATTEEAAPAPVEIDDDAPNFTVEMVNGESISLESLRGKVVLLNFWATWCPPCREELKRVQADVIDRFAGRDFVFLPISRGEEKSVVVEFLKENGYTFNAGLDTDKSIYGSYANEYIPRNFLINRHGVIVEATIGYDEEEFENLLQTIEMTLNAR